MPDIATRRHLPVVALTDQIKERTGILNGRRLAPAVTALAVAALAAAGCSSSSSTSAGATPGTTIDIYSSLPMQGSSSAQTIPMVNGIKLALAQANDKAGQFTVNYQVLDDSTAAA